ncbi:hypothetical protein TSAR_010989, partial [Trichomalopsis sarcophagae]
MWLAHLPKPVQTYLSVFKVDSVDELLEDADKLIQQNIQVSSVNPVGITSYASSGCSTPTREVDLIQHQLTALKTTFLERALQSSQRNSQPRGRRRKHSNSRQRGRSPANRPDWCWNHNRYSASAINCTKLFILFFVHTGFVATLVPRSLNAIVADIPHAIPGANFLIQHGLIVEVKKQRIINRKMLLASQAALKKAAVRTVSFIGAIQQHNIIQEVRCSRNFRTSSTRKLAQPAHRYFLLNMSLKRQDQQSQNA